MPGSSLPMYAQPTKKHKVDPPSCTTIDVAGMPVNVYGLSELSRGSHGGAPEVCITFHMHGRTGSARREHDLVRELWQNAVGEREGLQGAHRVRDLIIVSLDQRNHGHRTTNELGQRTWKEGNPTHGIDQYAMYHGTAMDVSYLMDLLPAYLFPNGERIVSLFAVTGKSMGGHAAWHVLAHDPRVRVGVPFIGMPDYEKLLAQRTKTSNVNDGPPQVPDTLRALIRRIDPAKQPYREASPSNPFFGKKICICCGEDDKLVRFSFSEEFIRGLVVAPPNSEEARRSLEVFVQPNTGHKVTSEMLALGGRWLAQWALAY